MAEERVQRRLAAILAADVVGYSRLMGANEAGTRARFNAHLHELIELAIASRQGRIVKTTGDALLVEFASVVDAVQCAVDIQNGMVERNADEPDDRRMDFRIGVNLGDVIVEGDDIHGDGVNVAARLEGLAEPGGVCISDIVHQTLLDRLNEPFRDMGGQRVKNISRPIRVWQWTPDAPPKREAPEVALKQRVQFTTSADGTQIAWAGVGEGPPVFKAPNYLNHIEYEWTSPFWGPFLAEFARNNRLVRFDQRGNGLSDWDIEKITPDAMIEDMEAVVAAAGLERFALFGISQGTAFSVRYATKHPERVSCLILFNGYTRGRKARGSAEEDSLHNAALTMIREGWGSTNPIYRNFFTSSFLTDASQEIKDSFDELQRISGSAENVMRIASMNSLVDNTDYAQHVRVPTLVLHIVGDKQVPVSEGRLTARLIPGAQFVEMPGNNHVALEGSPCFGMFFDEVRAFLAEHN